MQRTQVAPRRRFLAQSRNSEVFTTEVRNGTYKLENLSSERVVEMMTTAQCRISHEMHEQSVTGTIKAETVRDSGRQHIGQLGTRSSPPRTFCHESFSGKRFRPADGYS
jgi:hypothetical protein